LAIALLAAAVAPAGATAFGPLSGFGSFGEGAGQISQPVGIAIGADGTTYVSDFGNSRIDVFNSQGAFLFAFGKGVNPQGGNTCTALTGCRAGAGDGSAGALNSTEDIELGPEGNVFVVDSGNRRIDVFSAAGTFLFAFGKKVNPGSGVSDFCAPDGGCRAGEATSEAGGLLSPAGLGIDPAGRLFVTDLEANRVNVFSADGAFLFAFGGDVNPDRSDLCTLASGCMRGSPAGTAGAISSPFDVEIAPSGEVFVSALGNRRVDVFATGGEFLRAFGKGVNPLGGTTPDLCTPATACSQGEQGAAAGALSRAAGVAIDTGGNVYVADSDLNRIDQFSAAGVFLRAFGTGVVDGSEAFQVCDLVCRAGSATQTPGSVPFPNRVAVDCHGVLNATIQGGNETVRFNGIARFGEQAPPPCGPPPTAATPPSNRFKLGKLVLNKKRGTAALSVTVPGPGGLVLKGKGIGTIRRAVRAAGKLKLLVKPTGKAKRKLAKTGAVRLKAKVTFTPTGGTAATQVKTLRLKRLPR
jgi:DNA-binding beta-propeller fold protein YncE